MCVASFPGDDAGRTGSLPQGAVKQRTRIPHDPVGKRPHRRQRVKKRANQFGFRQPETDQTFEQAATECPHYLQAATECPHYFRTVGKRLDFV